MGLLDSIGSGLGSITKALDVGNVVKGVVDKVLPNQLHFVGDVAGAVVDYETGNYIGAAKLGMQALQDLPQAAKGAQQHPGQAANGGTAGGKPTTPNPALDPSPPPLARDPQSFNWNDLLSAIKALTAALSGQSAKATAATATKSGGAPATAATTTSGGTSTATSNAGSGSGTAGASTASAATTPATAPSTGASPPAGAPPAADQPTSSEARSGVNHFKQTPAGAPPAAGASPPAGAPPAADQPTSSEARSGVKHFIQTPGWTPAELLELTRRAAASGSSWVGVPQTPAPSSQTSTSGAASSATSAKPAAAPASSSTPSATTPVAPAASEPTPAAAPAATPATTAAKPAPAASTPAATSNDKGQTISSLSQLQGMSDAAIRDAVINGRISPDFAKDQAGMMALQQRMNAITEMNNLMTTMMRAIHDMQMAVIQNIRI